MYRALLFIMFGAIAIRATAADLRIGIIGADTSHVLEFTKLINDPSNKHHVPGGKVTVIFKGGSKDIPSSWSKIDRYSNELAKNHGVRIVDSIETLCGEVDAVLLESVDGRVRLEQIKPVLKARKPVFIDKPIAGSLQEAVEICRLAKAGRVPVFSSSSFRYYDSMVELLNAKTGKLRGAISYGPCTIEPHHPDFFWYGIHPIEALFTVMGTGCQTVVRTASTDTDVATGTWADGRTGVFYALHGSAPHKVIVFGADGIAEQRDSEHSYAPLVREIMKFFQTGIAPVPPETTLEIYAFMEAADESKRRGGVPVKISEVMKLNGGTLSPSTAR